MKPTAREQFAMAPVIDEFNGHVFVRISWIGHPVCRRCGAVRRRDRGNSPCRGQTRVTPRKEGRDG